MEELKKSTKELQAMSDEIREKAIDVHKQHNFTSISDARKELRVLRNYINHTGETLQEHLSILGPILTAWTSGDTMQHLKRERDRIQRYADVICEDVNNMIMKTEIELQATKSEMLDIGERLFPSTDTEFEDKIIDIGDRFRASYSGQITNNEAVFCFNISNKNPTEVILSVFQDTKTTGFKMSQMLKIMIRYEAVPTFVCDQHIFCEDGCGLLRMKNIRSGKHYIKLCAAGEEVKKFQLMFWKTEELRLIEDMAMEKDGLLSQIKHNLTINSNQIEQQKGIFDVMSKTFAKRTCYHAGTQTSPRNL